MISTVSLACLAAAVALGPARPHHRIGRAEKPRSRTKNPRDGPLDSLRIAADIDLFAACLRAGVSHDSAAAAVASTYDGGGQGDTDSHIGQRWSSVVALNAVGVEPERAWEEMVDLPGLSEVADLVALSSRTGSSLAAGCERIAEALREESADKATAQAERAGVLISIPLALCFLPAFFILGLAPVVISLGMELLPQ
ncbi:type II secretion system F family protein [Corynebacterium breve]|uniref:Type II secretion system F family protein n=1 Tax=Corynebacterium breve TaxID=3049799 RepID=A0ABY8VGP6_9CORY|nr:type II secretion system F family protein [Corynebacterium breve]WIM67945.1 type II secretion system F family protein [Corynebacterium breve]